MGRRDWSTLEKSDVVSRCLDAFLCTKRKHSILSFLQRIRIPSGNLFASKLLLFLHLAAELPPLEDAIEKAVKGNPSLQRSASIAFHVAYDLSETSTLAIAHFGRINIPFERVYIAVPEAGHGDINLICMDCG